MARLTIVMRPLEGLLQDVEHWHNRTLEVLRQYVADRKKLSDLVLDATKGPKRGFDAIDISTLARFDGAKSDQVTWKELGQYIEFWSGVLCLRAIIQFRAGNHPTEADVWREAWAIAGRYANMEAARAWAAGMASKSGGKAAKPSRSKVTIDAVKTELETNNGQVHVVARKLKVSERTVRRKRPRKSDS